MGKTTIGPADGLEAALLSAFPVRGMQKERDASFDFLRSAETSNAPQVSNPSFSRDLR